MNIKRNQRIEQYSRFICHHNIATIFVVIFLSLGLISQLSKLQIDTSTEGLFHTNDPVVSSYKVFKQQFGRDDVILIAIESEQIFSIPFLKQLKQLHQRLENEVPHISKISSLINARSTLGKENELIVEDLLENFPENQEQLQRLKKRVLSNPAYLNALISQDGIFTNLIIEPQISDSRSSEPSIEDDEISDIFDDSELLDNVEEFVNSQPTATTKPENKNSSGVEPLTDNMPALIQSLKTLLAQYPLLNSKLYIGGTPLIDDTVKAAMQKDMGMFMGLSILVIGIFLFLLFGSIKAVLLPLIVVILSLLTTLSLMAILGYPLKLPTQILPSFLLVVGVGDSVHILAIYYKKIREGLDNISAIIAAMQHSTLAITMTSITTAGGLLAFVVSDIAPVSDLGIFAPIGVMMALFLSVVLLPAILSLFPEGQTKPVLSKPEPSTKPVSKKQAPKTTGLDKLLLTLVKFALSHPKKILISSGLVVCIALVGATTLTFSYNPLLWLPENAPVRIATTALNQSMRGSTNLEIVLDSRKPQGWYEPELLNKLEQASNYADEYIDANIFVGKTSSLNHILKEIHQALNENKPEFYKIPQQRDLVAQEFLIFENSGTDDLEDVVDSQFSQVRLSLRMPARDAIEYTRFLEHYEHKLHEIFGNQVEITMTGVVTLLFRAVEALSISMAESYVIALLIISLLMILFIGNIKLGLISLIPNLIPIIMVLGIMGWFKIPLDAFTLLIGSIAIGLVVDDTIHFLNSFNNYYKEDNNSHTAIKNSTLTTGRAIVTTSIVLSIGFFIYMLATLSNLFYFGLLTGLTILFALVAELLITPAVLAIAFPNQSSSMPSGQS